MSLSYFLVIQFSFCFSPRMPFLSFLSLEIQFQFWRTQSGMYTEHIEFGHRTPLSVGVVTVFTTCFYCFLFHYLNNYAAGLLRMCSKEEKKITTTKKRTLKVVPTCHPMEAFRIYSFFFLQRSSCPSHYNECL